MDSLTQAVLGACVGAACAPPSQRRRGLLYGAALGTLPDLDVLLPAADPVSAMVGHRSFSHSLLVLSVLAPLLHALLARLDAHLNQPTERWRLAFWLCLVTHPLLDWCTTYGTQLLWPLDTTPYALGSIFIIDPLYTLPLLLAVLVVACSSQTQRQRRWLQAGLGLSSLYLLWCAVAQSWVGARVSATALARLGLPADTPVHVGPAPLNSLLWRILIVDPAGGWHEGWFSILSESTPQPLLHHHGLPAPAAELADLRRLATFSHGWYALREQQGQLWYADLRMGVQPWLAFRFGLAERTAEGRWQALQPALHPPLGRPPTEVLGWVLRRILDPHASLPAAMADTDAGWTTAH